MIGIILAGGAATRMGGGDKGSLAVGGRRILDRVIATMAAQCDALLLNANGDAARFLVLGLPIVADETTERLGPLAGILAGLDWLATHHPGETHIVTAPTDTPFLPADLVARLSGAPTSLIACARSAGRLHPTAARWPVAHRAALRRALHADVRKVGLVLEQLGACPVDWPNEPYDPFFNINAPSDLAAAEAIARNADADPQASCEVPPRPL